MKKKITLFLLLPLILILGLTGCGKDLRDPDYNATITKSEYFEAEVIEHTNTGYVIRDTKTNVLYITITGYSGSMIMPLYNADGSLQIYETAQ